MDHDNLEVVYVNKREVCCDGGNKILGHPKVYLRIKENFLVMNDARIHTNILSYNNVVCPYCGKVFVYKKNH